MPRPTIEQLAARLEKCESADQLALAAAKRVDRLRRDFNEYRRNTNALLDALRRHVDELLLYKIRNDK